MSYVLGDVSDDGYWLLTKNGWEETKNNNQKTETLGDLISNLKIEFYESLSIIQLKEIADKNNMTYINSYNGHSKRISSLKEKFQIIDEMVKLNFNFNSKNNQDLIHREFLGTPSCNPYYGCSCVYKKHCFNLVKSVIGNDELIKLGIYQYSSNLYMKSDYLNLVSLVLGDYNNVSMKFLKPYAIKKGLIVKGSKSDLIEKLVEWKLENVEALNINQDKKESLSPVVNEERTHTENDNSEISVLEKLFTNKKLVEPPTQSESIISFHSIMVNEATDSEDSALEKLFTKSTIKSNALKSADTINEPLNGLDQTKTTSDITSKVNQNLDDSLYFSPTSKRHKVDKTIKQQSNQNNWITPYFTKVKHDKLKIRDKNVQTDSVKLTFIDKFSSFVLTLNIILLPIFMPIIFMNGNFWFMVPFYVIHFTLPKISPNAIPIYNNNLDKLYHFCKPIYLLFDIIINLFWQIIKTIFGAVGVFLYFSGLPAGAVMTHIYLNENFSTKLDEIFKPVVIFVAWIFAMIILYVICIILGASTFLTIMVLLISAIPIWLGMYN